MEAIKTILKSIVLMILFLIIAFLGYFTSYSIIITMATGAIKTDDSMVAFTIALLYNAIPIGLFILSILVTTKIIQKW